MFVLDVCTAVKNLDTEMPLNKALLRTIEGVSPIVCREIEYKVMEDATNRLRVCFLTDSQLKLKS